MPQSRAQLLENIEALQAQLQEERAWREAYAAENARLMAALLQANAAYDVLCQQARTLWTTPPARPKPAGRSS